MECENGTDISSRVYGGREDGVMEPLATWGVALHQLAATELISDDNLLGRINTVNLEYVLGDIQSDRGDLHVDGSPDVIRSQRLPYGSSMLGAGAVHHINRRQSAAHSIPSSASVSKTQLLPDAGLRAGPGNLHRTISGISA